MPEPFAAQGELKPRRPKEQILHNPYSLSSG